MTAPLLQDIAFDRDELLGLLPIDFPPRPVKPQSSSARLRARHAGKFQVWREACKMVVLLNGLDRGDVNFSFVSTHRLTKTKSDVDRMKVASAVSLVHARLLSFSARMVRARRGET